MTAKQRREFEAQVVEAYRGGRSTAEIAVMCGVTVAAVDGIIRVWMDYQERTVSCAQLFLNGPQKIRLRAMLAGTRDPDGASSKFA